MCPWRVDRPPGWAAMGKICPGLAKSPGEASGSAKARNVIARSCADSPLVVPLVASIETVKRVPCRAVFNAVIGASCSCSALSGVIAAHNTPLACRSMRVTVFDVIRAAAATRSPSFSRSTSSTSNTIFPLAIASVASSTVAIVGTAVLVSVETGL